MLTREQVRLYNENGFLTVEGVVPMPLVEDARQAVEGFVERSRSVADHDDVYDLEPGHAPEQPRVRRLKEPCAIHPIFDRISRLDACSTWWRPWSAPRSATRAASST